MASSKKVPDKKMVGKLANTASLKKKAQLHRQHIQQLRAVKRVQRAFRGFQVRSALAQLVAVEDLVLRRPTAGDQVVELLVRARAQAEAGADDATSPDEGREAGEVPTAPPSRTPSLPLPAAPDVPLSAVTEDDLARHLEREQVCGTVGGAISDPAAASRKVFRLLGADRLVAEHFDRVCRHHRLRRVNANSKIVLRLALMQPGESSRVAPKLAAHVVAAGEKHGAYARALLPEGWAQVTRTAWSFRHHGDWAPTLVLTSDVRCCVETAERLRSVVADDGGGEGGGAGAPPGPAVCVCADLDRTSPQATRLGVGVHHIAATMTGAVTDNTDQSMKNELAPPPVLSVVTAGANLEALLAAVTADGRRADLITGRLGGGDAVLLRSPPMCRIVGNGEGERVRSATELWTEALKLGNWEVVHHIRGDGKKTWQGGFGSLPFASTVEHDGAQQSAPETEAFGATWQGFAGAPLVLSQLEFTRLCERAGSTTRPLPPIATNKLRPLVRDFAEDGHHRAPSRTSSYSKLSSKSRQSPAR